ncbi:MAG: hypothetical protein J7641_16295 [Cyanobacteria bacterium SID2]|nr:hypothetical protein [Cyanobacteria bacterium SID2]
MVLNAGDVPRMGTTVDLTEWAYAALDVPGVCLAAEVRGTDLHVWCWGTICPEASSVMARLSQAIHQDFPIPQNIPNVNRVCLYGRSIDALPDSRPPFDPPDWTVRFAVTPVSSPSKPTLPDDSASPQLISDLSPAEIDRALQNIAKDVWIAVKKIEPLAGTNARRLWVVCEAAYAPDPTLLARPIACLLRDLNLQGFRDAVLLGQVSGETRPEWMLRVDLTPSDRTVEAWARWGDVGAIAYRLNQSIESLGLQISAVLKESTLHLVCSPQPAFVSKTNAVSPNQTSVMGKLESVLNAIAPRGIQGIVAYGMDVPYEASFPEPKTPLWVTWLDLPAKHRPDLVPTAFDLARNGNLSALTFGLERLLNPNLDEKLATGGISVRLRLKGDLLHVMSEGLACPAQNRIGPLVVKFLRQAQLSDIAGVRVYGRRSGQRKPRWHYGVDFKPRSDVPAEIPDFSKVEPLDREPPSSPVERDATAVAAPAPAKPPRQRRSLPQLLCATNLFRPAQPLPEPVGEPTRRPDTSAPAAAVWVLLGLLLTVQADWIASEVLDRRERAMMPPPETTDVESSPDYAIDVPELPDVNVKPEGIFDPTGFTAPTHAATVFKPELSGEAAIVPAPEPTFPTFHSEQMDRQLALYQAYIDEFGVPDVLVVGSSRSLRGIDPQVLQQSLDEQGYPSVRVFNLGVNGATAQVVNFLISEVLPPDRLPKSIVWADGARAFNSGREDATYNAIVRSPGYQELARGFRPVESERDSEGEIVDRSFFEVFADGYRVLDDNLNELFSQYSATYPKRDVLKVYGKAALSNREVTIARPDNPTPSLAELPEDDPILHFNGFLAFPDRFDPTRYYLQHPRVSGTYDGDYTNFQMQGGQANALASLVEYVQSQKIDLVFVSLPLTRDYLDPVRTQYEQQFVREMLARSQQYGFVFRDFAQMWPEKNEYFSDPSHLNRYGAAAVSHRLARSPMVNWTGNAEK